MSNRAERIAAYHKCSKEADELVALGQLEEAKKLLNLQRATAEQAGDEDYRRFFQAEILFVEGKYSEAIQSLDVGLGWAKEHGHASDAFLFQCRGVYETFLGNPNAAIGWFDKALALNPKDADALRNKGVALFKKGQEDAAIEWYDKALALNPNSLLKYPVS